MNKQTKQTTINRQNNKPSHITINRYEVEALLQVLDDATNMIDDELAGSDSQWQAPPLQKDPRLNTLIELQDLVVDAYNLVRYEIDKADRLTHSKENKKQGGES